MTPAITALLDRIDPDRTHTAGLADDALDDRVASRLAARLIGLGRPAPDPVDALLTAIADLHLREGDGESVPAKIWTAARGEAVALSGASDTSLAPAAALAEAAAWPVADTCSGLTDIVAALAPAARAAAAATTGWSAADGDRAEAALRRIAADHPGDDRTTIPPRFAAAEPALARRFVAQLDAMNAASHNLSDTVLAALFASLHEPEARA